jgi:hypothetical protein
MPIMPTESFAHKIRDSTDRTDQFHSGVSVQYEHLVPSFPPLLPNSFLGMQMHGSDGGIGVE